MRHTKRLLALVLTLALAFGLAMPVLANTSNNVFVNLRNEYRRNIIVGLTQLKASSAETSIAIPAAPPTMIAMGKHFGEISVRGYLAA